jgi:SAM-dependent methyltransferase
MRSTVKKFIRPIFRKLQYTSLMQAVEEELEMQSYSGVTSRHFEYPFTISELVALSRKKKINKVLDAGSYGSPLALMIASLGFNVVGADIIPWNIQFPDYTHAVEDLKALTFKNDHFDLVTAVSTMEHCGLSRFGEQEIENGDIKGARELFRVLKPGGDLILTVPYARNYSVYQNKHRIYDKKRFKRLLGKFTIKKERFFAPIDDSRVFRPCSKREIESFRSQNGSFGVICVVCRKPYEANDS